MNPFKKIALTLAIILAFFAGDAAAACNMTLKIQLPVGWPTTFYIFTSGNNTWTAQTYSPGADGYYTIDMSTVGGNNNTGFLITRKGPNDNNQWNSDYIDQNGTGNGHITNNATHFTCPNDGSTWYLTFATGSIYYSKDPPNAKFFHFLPPKDQETIIAIPYIWTVGSNTAPVRMSIDPSRCGWYRMVYHEQTPPGANTLILLSPENPAGTTIDAINPKERIGLLGWDEDPTEWVLGFPTRFNLDSIFNAFLGSSPGDVFFVPDQGRAGWTSLDPMIDEPERCKYNMAAILYKHAIRYPAANGALTKKGPFSQHDGMSDSCGGDNTGLIKGIVRETLNENRKMVAVADTNKLIGSGWCASDLLHNAFKFTSGYNIEACYDMPFERVANGNWEFDSDRMINPNDGLVGGFFPNVVYDYDVLYNKEGLRAFKGGDTVANKGYNECSACRVDGGISSSPSINTGNVSAVTWRGQTYTGIDAFDRRPAGSFTPSYDYNDRVTPTPRPVKDETNLGRNYICFESHAEFTYEGGEEFFFRGDDDIWVFINNRLVLDLGGNHEALPGYVDLDTIGGCTYSPAGSNNLSCSNANSNRLVRGQSYNLDIFFCDRRGSNANVRISTSIYFSQKNELKLASGNEEVRGDVCFETSGGGSCGAVLGTEGTEKKCGKEIASDLEYYMTNRAGTQTIDLSADNTDYCTASADGDLLTCYGGIKIYRSSGQVEIDQDAIFGLSGTYYVYVQFKEGSQYAEQTGATRIATISRAVPIQVVWGTVRSESGATLYNIPAHPNTVAGKPVPIGFAAGGFNSDKSVFSVTTEGRGQKFNLIPSSLVGEGITSTPGENLDRGGLRVFEDAEATREIENFRENGFTIPDNGILVLYVTGVFEAEDDAKYSINVRATDQPFELKVYQPRIKFVDPEDTAKILSDDETKYSAVPRKGLTARENWVWQSEAVYRTVVAYDPSANVNNENSWVPCGSFCHFNLRTEASAFGPDDQIGETNNMLIRLVDGEMNAGTAVITFTGQVPVYEDYFAELKVGGPSRLEKAMAKWDSLQFRELPVPYPVAVDIYDSKGGGIGDSIRITYNKSFRDTNGVLGDFPNLIEIEWEEGTKVTRSLSGVSIGADGKPNEAIDKAANEAYWKKYLQSDEMTIVIADAEFSEKIKTSGEGILINWVSFESDGTEYHLGSAAVIVDSMPPIIISADYTGEDRNKYRCGNAESNPCNDYITIKLSEPVVLASDASNEAILRPFAYLLKNFNQSSFGANNKSAISVSWGNTNRSRPAETGDSVVTLTFEALTNPLGESTPLPGDSVRFLAENTMPESHILRDLMGNRPHPREWGKPIEGKAPFLVDKNLIADVVIGGEDDLKNSLRDLFADTDVNVEDMFKDSKIEFLPVLGDWTLNDVKANFPGSVGAIFKPDIYNGVKEFQMEKNLGDNDIGPEDITFYAKSFYHTNLGSYVVESKGANNSSLITIKCNDPIFQINGKGDCMSTSDGGVSNVGIYLAWDLRDSKGRWAGTGAYVQVYDFWWEIEYKSATETIKSGALDKYNKVEMFGVKRIKKR